jgi:hypothetical protein
MTARRPIPRLSRARVAQLVTVTRPEISNEEEQRRLDEQAIRDAILSPKLRFKTRDVLCAVALAARYGYRAQDTPERAEQRLRISQAFTRLLAEGDVVMLAGKRMGERIEVYTLPSEHADMIGYNGEAEA